MQQQTALMLLAIHYRRLCIYMNTISTNTFNLIKIFMNEELHFDVYI